MTGGFGLYVILTEPEAGYERAAAAATEEEAAFLQLRMKDRPEREVLDMALKLRKITRGSKTRFIVNDSLETARDADADGVHLGREDMALSRARELWRSPGKIFGLSTHSIGEAEAAAAAGADYIGVGPVFPTPTKPGPDPALGADLAAKIARESPVPAVAIGGITEENLPLLLSLGVRTVACVRPVCGTSNPAAAIRRWQAILRTAAGDEGRP
ncbi:MAG TPA: thiamine phosphate synthase [bacterium]|nr:thiamine phosphate synthase [bacterium]HPQ67089.1 thiamine phosphate synthase [bacterium]